MLSLVGDIPDDLGVGDGEGAGTIKVDLAFSVRVARTLEPPAMAKLFNKSPTIHARALMRTIVSFRGVLGIISLLRNLLNIRHPLRSKCPLTNT